MGTRYDQIGNSRWLYGYGYTNSPRSKSTEIEFVCISALEKQDHHLAAIIRFIHRSDAQWSSYSDWKHEWLWKWIWKLNDAALSSLSLSQSRKKNVLTSSQVLTGFFCRLNFIHRFTTVAIFSPDWQVDQKGAQIQVTEGQSSLNWNGCSADESFAYAVRNRAAGDETWTPAEVEDSLLVSYTRDRRTQLLRHVVIYWRIDLVFW